MNHVYQLGFGVAVLLLTYVWNCVPTAPLPDKTPYEGWNKCKPDVSHLRVWRCLAYVYIQGDKCKSLQSHIEKCIFVGYPAGYKGWEFYNPVTNKYIISERADFDERCFPGLSTGPMPKINLLPTATADMHSPNVEREYCFGFDDDDNVFTTPLHIDEPDAPIADPGQPAELPQQQAVPPPSNPPRCQRQCAPVDSALLQCSTHPTKQPGEWWKVDHPPEPDDANNLEFEGVQFAGLVSGADPCTYKQAMKGNNAHMWEEAATTEFNLLQHNLTWERVELPPGQKAIGSGWVFKIKRNADGTIERYKACIIAKGFNGDVKIIVPIYIDDITFASKSDAAIDKAVKQLAAHFTLCDLGPTQFLLGVAVERDFDAKTITLHQRQYILDMLDTYGMSDSNPVKTPMAVGTVLFKADGPQNGDEVEYMCNVPYLNAVSSLQYLATMTRPDIAYTVSYLACFNSNPGPKHWAAVKHLFRYLRGTLDLKLTYSSAVGHDNFITYTDVAHGDCMDTGRSTSGYLTLLAGGAIGWSSKLQTVVTLSTTEAEYIAAVEAGAIGWSSKLQTVVTLSTTEAEYIAAVEAGKEIAWMCNILHEFGYTINEPSMCGPTHVFTILLLLANTCLWVGHWPKHFKESMSVIILKLNKPSYSAPKAFRPIVLLNTVGKLIENMLSNRIQFDSVASDIFHPNQIGGIHQRSIKDAGLILMHIVHAGWAKGLKTSVIAFDVAQLFPSLNHEVLMAILRKLGVSNNVVKFFSHYLANVGVGQGRALFPVLSALYLTLIMRLFKLDPLTFSARQLTDNPPVDLGYAPYTGATPLKPKMYWQYLGFYFDRKLTFTEHVQYYSTKALLTVKVMKMLGSSTRGLHPVQKRVLYCACVLPIVMYGFRLWYFAAARCKGALHHLSTMQQITALWITGVFRTSPTGGVEALAGLPPINLLLRRLSECTDYWFATLTLIHPSESEIFCTSGTLFESDTNVFALMETLLLMNPLSRLGV
ncbi:hypothetical protein CVT25_009428 [Psilocybe cyanescens]|uniref:Reverse transcriptase domain-containing protein n=1 Tax=Psilocybe cyanescens TaxID=93625 RepID=A0A409XV12_PSICY|nr:hypothetical protein CVT25_009428 [Psilocybe cyanescens]